MERSLSFCLEGLLSIYLEALQATQLLKILRSNFLA